MAIIKSLGPSFFQRMNEVCGVSKHTFHLRRTIQHPNAICLYKLSTTKAIVASPAQDQFSWFTLAVRQLRMKNEKHTGISKAPLPPFKMGEREKAV